MRRVCMLLLPPAALVGGYWLRMQQSLIAASDAVPAFFKNSRGVCLWAVPAALALLLLLLGFGENRETDFQTSCRAAVGLPFQWAGTVLFCFAGINAAMAFWPAWQSPDFYVNAATALAAFFLLPAVLVRFKRSDAGLGFFLLPPLLLTLYRLLRYYLSIAADPYIRAHEMHMVFFASFALFLLSLSALAFGDHCRRRLLLFAGLTVGTAGAAMFDTADFNDSLLIVAGTALAFGFYLSALFVRKDSVGRRTYETVQDKPFAAQPKTEAPETAVLSGDPFPVIFDDSGNKMPPPEAAPASADEKKADGELDLSRVDRLMREMK